MPNLLSIDIKRLYHKDLTLMRDLSLRVQSDERIIIIGPTGGGKSSLLNTFNLMNQSYDGEILFEGIPLKAYPPQVLRTRICMVMQEPFLGEGTVQDVLNEPLTYAAIKSYDHENRDLRTASLFESFQLPIKYLDKKADLLSGGEKQRVALIRALLLSHRSCYWMKSVLLWTKKPQGLFPNVSLTISRHSHRHLPRSAMAKALEQIMEIGRRQSNRQ
jgi:putative ABC transport system ATP-binding protein